jgi:hypothetical protein
MDGGWGPVSLLAFFLDEALKIWLLRSRFSLLTGAKNAL